MPTFEEAEKLLLKEYNDYKKLSALKQAGALPMDAVIHKCSQENYPKKYLQQFMDKHFSKGEKDFYSLIEKGIIIRADDSTSPTPTTPNSYKFDSLTFTSYAIYELSKNREYLYSPSANRNIYEELQNLVNGIFSNCGAVMDYNLTTNLTKKTGLIYNECLKEDNKTALKKAIYEKFNSQTEMEKLNALITSADENGKQTDRTKKAESCKDLMKQLDYAMIGHKKRGFWSMVFHPVTYYREYKAIETAKTTLVEKYNLKQDFVDKYTKYLNDVIETDLEYGKTKRAVNVEINLGDKIETKVKGFSADFSDRIDCLDKANETIKVGMKNIEGLVGEKAWAKLTDMQKGVLEKNWNELSNNILGEGNKDKVIDGTVMDKLVEKYYGLTPDRQNEEDYQHKKLVIMNGFLRDNGYEGIPYLDISEDENILSVRQNQSNDFDSRNDDIDLDDRFEEYNSIDYSNFDRSNTSVTEAVKFVHEEASIQNLVDNEPDLEDIENDTMLAEQKKVNINNEPISSNDKQVDFEQVL